MIIARPSTVGAVAAVAAFGLPVAYSPMAGAPSWSTKAAMLLVAGAVGLPMLRPLLRSEQRRAAMAAIAFVGVAALSTAVSPEPLLAVTGLYNAGTGLLFLAACVGVWALGACIPRRDLGVVLVALVAGFGASAAVGLLQTLDVVEAGALGSRASGLAGNPVHLGSLAAGAAAIGVALGRQTPAWVVLAGGGALAAQLSGARAALLVVLALAGVSACVATGVARVLLISAIGAGIVAGSFLTDAAGQTSATGRLTTGRSTTDESVVTGGTTQVRLEVWRTTRHAIARRPLLGHGPGRFRAATSRDRTLREAQIEGGDKLYTDAHNSPLQFLVTTGGLGTVALAAWVGIALRRARGAFAWFAFALLVVSFVQPLHVGVTPLLFLALGAAGAVGVERTITARTAVLVVPAFAVAVALFVGDHRLHASTRDHDLAAARVADRLLPDTWFQVPMSRGLIYAAIGENELAQRWWAESHRRDPSAPVPLLVLGEVARVEDRPADAKAHYLAVLERNPWSSIALRGLALVAERRGDLDSARSYARRALEVGPDSAIDSLLRRLD